MPEIKRKPAEIVDEGETLYIFDDNHSLADIVRFFFDQGGTSIDFEFVAREEEAK